MSAKTLVTGAAGFIGSHVVRGLLERGEDVVGVDNLSDYTPVQLKRDRLAQFEGNSGFEFNELDIAVAEDLLALFRRHEIRRVIHLAAQPGIRYSIQNPAAYVQANLVGFGNVLECCRQLDAEHLVYASSSSVYGANTTLPYTVEDRADHPISFYAATKRANELMAHSYSHLFRLPATGLRFFTVYGPWGRPDMAPMIFAKAISEGRPIQVFNEGRMERDFTYVDDVVDGILRVLDRPAAANPDWNSDTPDAASSNAPWRLYNIGNHQPVPLMLFIRLLEKELGREAVLEMKPLQQGDLISTYADTEALRRDVGFQPSTPIEVGVRRFIRWFRTYNGLPVPAESS